MFLVDLILVILAQVVAPPQPDGAPDPLTTVQGALAEERAAGWTPAMLPATRH